MSDEQKKWDDYSRTLDKTAFPTAMLEKYCSGKTVLDIGCGKGHHAAEVSKFASDVHAIDPSAKCIEEAKQKFPGIDFVVGSAYELPFKDALFDCVYSIDVIEHLDEPRKMLQESHRVLKKGGYLVLQTPNYPVKRLYDVLNYLGKSRWRKTWKDDPTHVSKFSHSSLKNSIEQFF